MNIKVSTNKIWLLCTMIISCILAVCCANSEALNNMQALETISELALLRHHPQSLQENVLNVNESFVLLVNDLQNHNLSQENVTFNCSHFSHLPKAFCENGLLSKCLSANDLLELLPQSTKSVSEALARVCPLLLMQLHSDSCTQSIPVAKPNLRPSSAAVWGYGLLFVTLISCCSLVGVVILPLLSKNIYHTVLMLFEGLAVGSLAGSSLFHLIPQTFHLVGQDIEHGYLWKSLIIFGGIYLFYLSERLMKIFIDVKEKKKRKKLITFDAENSTEPLKSLPDLPLSRRNSLTNPLQTEGDKENLTENGVVVPSEKLAHQNGFAFANGGPNTAIEKLKTCKTDSNSHSHHHDHAVHLEKGKSTISTVAWMIIFGDGLHNFIDGLSIGAAFSESILAGISISVAVVCEEFPHELGDFAVLLSAGMTMRQALVYNFLSAITCYGGLVLGILLGDLAEGSPYIFALAAGMFLYISLVDMMGELSEGIAEARTKGTKAQIKVLVIQNIGILLGVAILFIMARFAEHFNFESLSNIDLTSNAEGYSQSIYSGVQEAKQLHAPLSG